MSMDNTAAGGSGGVADLRDIQAALDRILSQPEFQSSSRLCEFLRFIVHESLAGRASQLKAFTIAVAVYGRDENFDAQSNSIVRVEATRLRRLLDRYYAGEGADDPVKILIPRGGYAPEFVRARAGEPDGADGASNNQALPARRSSHFGSMAAMALIVALLGGSGVIGYLAAHQFMSPAGPPDRTAQGQVADRPTVAVEILRPGEDGDPPGPRSVRKRLAIEHALDRFDDLLVVEGTGAGAQRIDYRVQVIAADDGGAAGRNIVRVIHSASGAILWSYPTEALASSHAAERLKVSKRIASAVGRPFGIIFSDQQRRRPASDRSRYGCVIASYNFLARPTAQRYDNARSCLQEALKKYPDFGSGAGLLALVYLDGWRYGFETRSRLSILDEVAQLALRAQLLRPSSTRSNMAAFRAEFARANYREAFGIGERLMNVDPDSTIAALYVAGGYVMRSDYARASHLFERIAGMGASFAPVANVYRFLLAYGKGEKEQAVLWAAARGMGNFPLGLVARIISNHQNGRIDAARHAAERLKDRFPAVFADIPAALDRYNMGSALREAILRDLKVTRLIPDLAQAGERTPTASVDDR